MKPPKFSRRWRLPPQGKGSSKWHAHSVRRSSSIVNLPVRGYGFLHAALDGVDAGPLLERLAQYRKTGRPGFSPQAMFRAYLARFLLGIRYANAFLERLGADPRLRALCGFGDAAPSESAFSRFIKRLSQHQDLVDAAIASVAARLPDELERLRQDGVVPADAPTLGEIVAIDSTDIAAYANPNRATVRDPDARWGRRTAKAGGKAGNNGKKEKTESFFGYKHHLLADAYYGLPLGGITLPANAADSPQLPNVLAQAQARHPWLSPRYLLADKGYDARSNFRLLAGRGITPVIAVRKPVNETRYDGIYTAAGLPTCVGGATMEYVGSDPELGHHFRCPAQGCHLKEQIHFSRYCDSEHWEKPEGKLLRIMGILPRFTDKWRRLYRMRGSIERHFSSAKHSRLLNQHQHQGIARVSLHVKMATLGYLATALARLRANDYAGMRRMSIRMPPCPARGRLWQRDVGSDGNPGLSDFRSKLDGTERRAA